MDKFEAFRALHAAPGAFPIPNPWDVGTAKLFEALGFKALATTSAGFAFSCGKPDGGIGFEAMIVHCREMAAASDLPVSADLEKGKGDSAGSAADTILAAEAAGLAGCSIEDHTGDPNNPIYDFSHAVERVSAAAEAVRSLKRPFLFTARAENFLWGRSDIDDTIARLQAFEKAGADVLYAPGIGDVETVRTVCSAVSRPVNVLARPHFTLAELAAAGAKRVSVGSALTTFAYGMLQKATRDMLNEGSFAFMGQSMPFSELQSLFAKDAR
jgi:2-methylisocitrate lyase-like PEP mutase family enzyme